MGSSSAITIAAPAAVPEGMNPGPLGQRTVRFRIRTGGRTWSCTLQDRAHYERRKAARAPSVDSSDSD